MRPEQISFSNYPGTFQLSVLRCTDVECSCTEVTFVLKEVSDDRERTEPPEKIVIRVDVATWQENAPPDRQRQIAGVVSEFLRDYPESEREELRAWHHERQRVVDRLQEYRIDPKWITGGKLIDFREILAPPDDSSWECPLGEYYLKWDDDYYQVIERFCSNPDCQCNEAILSFFRPKSPPNSPGRLVMQEQFNARLSLDGDVVLDEVYEVSRSEAKAVLSLWQEEYGDDLEKLPWRYEKIKEIARRSMPAGRANRRPMDAPQQQESTDRVGRNQPCPCGSGKKYKKCCGRNSDSIVDSLL